MSSFRNGAWAWTVDVHGLIVMLWWIYMIFMNQMRGVIRHTHRGWTQDHTGGPLVWQWRHFKKPFILFIFIYMKWLWNHCRIGFYCPGRWIICCIFLKNRLLCSVLVGKAILNDVCFMISSLKIYTTFHWALQQLTLVKLNLLTSNILFSTYSLFIMIVIFYTLGQWDFPVLSPRNYIYRYDWIVFNYVNEMYQGGVTRTCTRFRSPGFKFG